jgi:hypothetical protein
VIEGTDGYVCGDYLPPTLSAKESAARQEEVSQMVANPEDVQLQAAVLDGGSRGVGPGNYPYVIITDPSWVSGFQPLADWKIKKGLPATIVTTTWIYDSGGYEGDDAYKIQAFVRDAYTNWGTRFFLLGGDTNVIPTGSRHVIDDDIPNDTYYGDFDQDWVCEAHIGRAPARTSSDVTTFVNKTLTYQRTPPENFGNTAAFFGFDLNTCGSGEGEDCKDAIHTLYLPSGWTFHPEYDSQPGGHRNHCINFLNQGHNLTNHIDHASTDSMGAGSVCHGAYLNTSTMSGLTNGTRQGVLYTIGCWACDFASSTCIAEAFVRNPNGGGVAFVGNSRYGWYVPGSATEASSHFDRYFFRSLFTQNHYKLGDCFSDHKNDAYDDDDYSEYIFTELTLLGDPELPIWTAEPAELSVTHPSSIPLSAFIDFPVHVTSGGSPVSDATVCLWKGSEVYEMAQTDASGSTSFWFYASSLGALQVTVTKRNYAPYEGQSSVIQTTGPYALGIVIEGQGDVTATPPGGSYSAGTSVQVAASAAPDWCFDHWEDALTGSTTPATLVMDGNKILIAVFAPDCNGNSTPDAQDIASGYSNDCNENGVPDECDVAPGGSSGDCNDNGTPDECELAPPPYVEAADNCANAQVVCPGTIYYGTTVGATHDGQASCGSSGSSPDVWYYYEPLGNGYLTIRLCGSAYDTVLSVHGGCPGTTANEIVCNNDSCGAQSVVTLFVQNQYPYWIRVSGAGSAAGSFQMSLLGPECFYDLTDLDHDGILDECESCGPLGDANCDGAVNGYDIDPFVTALTNPTQWSAAHACDFLCANDCNGDGAVNGYDIDPFVTLLTGGR